MCVEWDVTGDPEEGADFSFSFGDVHKPDVELRSGAAWVVWSQEGENDDDPDTLGDITVKPDASSAEDFSVTVENPDSASGRGATSVESIVLDGAGASNWTGGSNIDGISITSNVNGGIKVVEDSSGTDDGEITGAVDIEGDAEDFVVERNILAAVTVDGDLNGAFTVGDDVTAGVTIGTAAAGGAVSGAISVGGDLSGALTIQRAASGSFSVTGDTTANVSIGYHATGTVLEGPLTLGGLHAALSVFGDYGNATAARNITVTEISGVSALTISGDVLGPSAITITNLGTEGTTPCPANDNDPGDGGAGSFTITGNVANGSAVIDVTNMATVNKKASMITVGGDFHGTVKLRDGVPDCGGTTTDNIVTISGDLIGSAASVGKVDLFDADVDGSLILGGSDADATVVRGGSIGGTFYPSQFGGEFQGTATFDAVEQDASIWAYDVTNKEADVSGTITVNGDLDGLFRVDGQMKSGSLFDLNGEVGPHSDDNGFIWIVEEMAGTVDVSQAVVGHVHFTKAFTGDLTIDGDLKASGGLVKIGDAAMEEDNTGDLTIGGHCLGAVDIDGKYSGTLDVAGQLRGTGSDGVIDIEGDLTSTGSVSIGANLSSSAEIVVGGSSSGAIDIAQQTGSSTLIHVNGGLLSSGTIVINSDELSYCTEQSCPETAAGDIRIGPFDESTPLPSVEFDGSITIFSECDGSEGDLDGNIDVVGCHDDADDLDIEFCNLNGAITITTTDCSGSQPTGWSGEGSCPEPSACP